MHRTYADLTGMTFWDVGRAGNPHLVSVGPYRINRGEILGCSMATVSESDAAGRLWSMALFAAGAAVLVIGVAEFDFRTRLLLGCGVLGLIALMAGFEAMKLRPITHFRLEIALKGGRHVRYATASRTDAELIAHEISAIGRENTTARTNAGPLLARAA